MKFQDPPCVGGFLFLAILSLLTITIPRYTARMKMPVSHGHGFPLTEDFSKSFMFSIHQMFFLVEKRLEHILSKRKSLSFSQFLILVGFHCEESAGISQSVVAERLHLTEATVSRHITTLVEQGLLSRMEDKANRRKHIIAITSKGKAAFKKTGAIVHKELDSIFSPIKEKDRANIMKNFSAVLDQLLSKK
jgi:DNA-binding MarR family transcriptional regulator